jgi:uncharacterized damage-inducible protein DinB
MHLASLAHLLDRELATLERQLRAYPDDASLWTRLPGVANPGGVLAHHLTGNLRHYIGARLGNTGYQRDRVAEFARTDLARAELLDRVRAARDEVQRTLATLDAAALESEYPDAVGGYRFRTSGFLLHLLAHLGYHLGQIDYHRRAVSGSAETTDAVATSGIPGARREN